MRARTLEIPMGSDSSSSSSISQCFSPHPDSLLIFFQANGMQAEIRQDPCRGELYACAYPIAGSGPQCLTLPPQIKHFSYLTIQDFAGNSKSHLFPTLWFLIWIEETLLLYSFLYSGGNMKISFLFFYFFFQLPGSHRYMPLVSDI